MALWKKLANFALSAALLVCLTGCGPAPSPETWPAHRVITQVEVSYRRGNLQEQRRYTDPEKMSRVLNCLRLLDPQDPPGLNPDRVAGHSFYITVRYSDGTRTDYHQKADQYLQIDGAGWRKIDRAQALRLNELLVSMPGDG